MLGSSTTSPGRICKYFTVDVDFSPLDTPSSDIAGDSEERNGTFACGGRGLNFS